jgi:hypothetical protein
MKKEDMLRIVTNTVARMRTMTKEDMLWLVLNSIFLIVFNALFFVLGGADRVASVWISYVFIHFAYFMLLLTRKLIQSGKSVVVFGFSLYVISSVYFLVELFTGSVFILIAMQSYKIPFLVQLCFAGFYGIILTAYMIADIRTADAEEKRQPHISFIKEASAKIKGLLESINDRETKKKVEQVYDTLYSSPVKSHPALESVEDHILKSVHALEDAVATGNRDSIFPLADTLEAAINERNRQLKTCN